MTKKRVHVYISGRVHGVCYRQNTLFIAGQLGIKGWVKNIPNNQVEAVFEGDSEAVDKIIEWCKNGPSMSRVTNIEMLEETYKGEFEGFRVKY